MSIHVTCANCKASLQVADHWAGKRGKCPRCQAALEVPLPDASPQPAGAAPAAKAHAREAAARETVSANDTVSTPAAGKGPSPSRAAVPKTQTKPSLQAASKAPQEVSPSTLPPAGEAAKTPSKAQAAPAAAAPAQGRPVTASEILAAFQGTIEPVNVSTSYRLGIFLVTLVMLLLPVVYMAVIGLVGYLVYLHARYDVGLIGVGHGRAHGQAVMIYLAPIVAGAILLLFMIKPLFARSSQDFKKRSVDPQREPVLFAFVERVCTAVGAPVPRRIDVDCQVNASASFRRGAWSMFGNDMVLTIGLPMVAGLNLQQFAGVLAHEFGHFSQGAGMRLTYLVRSISWWLTRAVYERDVWDDRLIEWSQKNGYFALAFGLARLFVWLTRRVLWVLMVLGHMVAGYMLRQMESDADRYEARLAGSDTFEATARQMSVLGVAQQGAQADLSQFFRDGRLGDNLPRLVMVNVTRLPDDVQRKINEAIDQSKTGRLDTHPCDRDRIENAKRENAPGVFHLTYPASVLFQKFGQLCKDVTGDFYRAVLGKAFNVSQIHPLDDLLARQGKDIEADKAVGRFFLGCFHVLRPLTLPSFELTAAMPAREAVAKLKEARQRMLDAKPAYERAYAVFDQADTRILDTYRAFALLRGKFKFKPGDFSAALLTFQACHDERNRAKLRQGQLNADLLGFEKAAADRLFHAMQLLSVPQVEAKVEQAAQRLQEAEKISAALSTVRMQLGPALELRNEHAAMETLLPRLEGNEQNQELIRVIVDQMREVRTRILTVREALSTAEYPFDHAQGSMSLGQYVLAEIPEESHLGQTVESARTVLEQLPVLYSRMMGRLVATAELVEKVLGLPPLEEPAPAAASEPPASG